MYLINNETLYLYYNNEKTLVKEINAEFIFNGNVLESIINNSCIYYGSSYKGRIAGSKSLLGCKYKLPILISEKNNIIFFPMVGEKKGEIIWFNFSMIKEFKKEKDFIAISFKNDLYFDFMMSFTVFNNQMYKCSRLWLNYLSRC